MTWAIAAIAILVGGILQRVSGLGMGMVCAPVLALLMGSAQGVLVTNGTATVAGFMIGLAVWRHADWRRVVIICLAAIPGAIAGALLVRDLPAAWLQVIIGAVVLLGVVTAARVPRLPYLPGSVAPVVAGAVGGLCNACAGVAGPTMVVYSRLSRWEQKSFAASLQPIFMTLGAMSVATKLAIARNVVVHRPWWFALLVVGTVAVAMWIGGKLARRVSSEHARTLAMLIAAGGAITTLVRGLLTLSA